MQAGVCIGTQLMIQAYVLNDLREHAPRPKGLSLDATPWPDSQLGTARPAL